MHLFLLSLVFQPVVEPAFLLGGRVGLGTAVFSVPLGDFGIPLGPKFVDTTAATSSVASFARLSLQENGRQMNLELSVEFQTQTSRGDAVRLDVRGDPYEHVYQSRTFQSVHVPLAARWSLGRTPVSGGFLVSFNGQFSSDFSLETERVPIDRHVVEDTFYVGFGLTGLWDGVRFGRWAIPLEARVVVNTQATTIERADARIPSRSAS